MAYGIGLGKNRSPLGVYIDRKRIGQGELAKASGKSRNTISELCDGDKMVNPGTATKIAVVGALRRMGHNVSPEDFWP